MLRHMIDVLDWKLERLKRLLQLFGGNATLFRQPGFSQRTLARQQLFQVSQGGLRGSGRFRLLRNL
jgi:hypothetical protein